MLVPITDTMHRHLKSSPSEA